MVELGCTLSCMEDMVAELVQCGPDPEVHLEGIKKFYRKEVIPRLDQVGGD
jgi:hypothetical protein